MIDQYFEQYDKLIQPLKHSLSTSAKNCLQKPSASLSHVAVMSDASTRDVTTTVRKEMTIAQQQDDFKSQIITERKKCMFLRQENIELKRVIESIRNEKKKLVSEVIKLKKDKEKDIDYVLKLEHLVNHLKNNSNTAKSKAATITQAHTEPSCHSVSLSGNNNTTIKDNHNNQNSDTKILYSLYQDNEIKKLEYENKKLLMFKSEIQELSKKYDQYNEAIVDLISNFSEMIKDLNEKCNMKIPIESNIELECYFEGKRNIDEVLVLMIKLLRTKQEEYNVLLNEKENDLNEVIQQYRQLDEKNFNMANIITQRNKEVEDLSNELILFKGSTSKQQNTNHSTYRSNSQRNSNSNDKQARQLSHK